MTIYIDSDCKCYTSPAEGRTAIETDFFSGKCVRYIEGYRYVPASQSTWNPADAEKQADAWSLIYRAVTAANKITFYAKAKPTVSIPLQIRCIRK